MSNKEKISLIENCMDLEEGTLNMNDCLDDFEEWDSLAALSIIAMIDERFHKTLLGNELKNAKIVADIVALME